MKPDHISNNLKYDIGNQIIKHVVKKHPTITQNQLRRVFSSLYRRLWKKECVYLTAEKQQQAWLKAQREPKGEVK